MVVTPFTQGGDSATYQEDATTVVIVAPIFNPQNQVGGAYVIKASNLHVQWTTVFSSFPVPILISLLIFLVSAGLVGAVFGFFTSRGFVKRFQSLAQTVDKWSEGDFSIFAKDASVDEIGQLASRLNRMAKQLQDFVQMRQELATIEERQRLARDLHDSVKQHMFALSLHLDAAKATFGQNEEATRSRLQTIDTLVGQVRDELTTLIGELRPVALVERDLGQALEKYVEQWQQQTGIYTNFQYKGNVTLPEKLEEALYRILQEALSNVARHSRASQVRVLLISDAHAVTLSIHDNGKGFNLVEKRGRG